MRHAAPPSLAKTPDDIYTNPLKQSLDFHQKNYYKKTGLLKKFIAKNWTYFSLLYR